MHSRSLPAVSFLGLDGVKSGHPFPLGSEVIEQQIGIVQPDTVYPSIGQPMVKRHPYSDFAWSASPDLV
jgi:hypothetical protein